MSKIGVLLFINTLILTALGIFVLYESSSYTALLQIGDEYFYVKRQLIFAVLAIISSLVVSRFDYRKFPKYSIPLLIVTFILLIIVFIPGVGLELLGARRWIDLGFFVLQPSELLKVSLTIYLAAWLTKKEDQKLMPFILVMAAAAGIVAIEPDLGTAVIIAMTAVVMYFLSGQSIRHLAIIAGVGVIGVIGLILMEPYRVARLTAFTKVDVHNLHDTSYHTKQILIALGSGGFSGVGLGNSVQKYAYLPEHNTDSIFAIYAEETGFIGAIVVISLFLLQAYCGFTIASRADDKFGKLLAGGITAFISIQAMINIGSQAILFPLTGVPLPFISYGGSSMMINYIAIGILLSIAARAKSPVSRKR